MTDDLILTLNAGSSTIKFAAYAVAQPDAKPQISGQIESFGANARLSARDPAGVALPDRRVAAADHAAGMAAILDLLAETLPRSRVVAAGHRVVHGGKDLVAPALIGPALIATLERLAPLAPLHQPHNLAGIRAAIAAFPGVPQVACFDTAFHRAHPLVADMYGLPLHFHEEGVRRYGFHGISYEYLTRRFAEIEPDLATGRVVYAHLGNGASLCAVAGGRSMASTMGFTPLDGVPMGTRPGQIDPGVLLYLMTTKGMDAAAIGELLYKQSGLKGMSGLSNDMRDLEASPLPAAGIALDYFVHRVRREIGALAADVGGLDAIVFAGGIGERAAAIRARILDGLGFLGVAYDPAANAVHALRLSPPKTRAPAFVVPTDEEWMIAQHVRKEIKKERSTQ